MRDLIILLVVFLALMILGCNSGSSTQTNYGDNAHFIITTGNDNSNIGNKTPAPVVVPPVVVVP